MAFMSSFTLGRRFTMLACMALYQDWAMAGSLARRNMELFLVDETTSKYLKSEDREDNKWTFSLQSTWGRSEVVMESSPLRRSGRSCYLFSVSGGHCFRDTWHIFRGMLRGSFTSAGKGSVVLWGEEGGESHGRAPPGEPELLKKADISLMYFTGLEQEGERAREENMRWKNSGEVIYQDHAK